MDTLSLHAVVKAAPAAAPVRTAREDGLISTSAFLRHVEREHGMKPVLAVQGKGHIDASRDSPAKMGRHFVVAAQPGDGIKQALFLLNSHQKHRRTHIGYGFWNKERESFLIGPSMAIQRWKGFKEPVHVLTTLWAQAFGWYEQVLPRLGMTDTERFAFGTYMARYGYTDFVEARPSAKALVDGLSGATMMTAFDIVARMRRGNLATRARGHRNIKGVRRPDGLFHAGLAAMHYIVTLAIEARKLRMQFELPRLDERLPRP